MQNDRTSVELLKKNNKRETITNWSKTNITDETTANSTVIVRADKFEPKSRKSVRKKKFLFNIKQ